jgi:DNA modification methylase
MNLLHGDCLKTLPTLAEGSVDLVVTSPPYNLGISYKTFKDTAPREEFLTWCRAWAAEVKRVMTDDASFFLNVGASAVSPLMPHQLIIALTDGDDPLFVLQNTFHWIKSITVETRAGENISAGHFKPINSKRYVNDCHEYVFHLTKTGGVELDRRPTKRSTPATRTARIRRRSPWRLWSSASASTARVPQHACSIHSSASAPRPLPRAGNSSHPSPASNSIPTIWKPPVSDSKRKRTAEPASCLWASEERGPCRSPSRFNQ